MFDLNQINYEQFNKVDLISKTIDFENPFDGFADLDSLFNIENELENYESAYLPFKESTASPINNTNQLLLDDSASSSPSFNSAASLSPPSSSPSSSSYYSKSTDADADIQASQNNEPISIVLPQSEKDGCKITSEIILNFDQLDQARFLDSLRELNETMADEEDSQSKVSSNENETCIELTNEKDSDMSDDELDDDLITVRNKMNV